MDGRFFAAARIGAVWLVSDCPGPGGGRRVVVWAWITVLISLTIEFSEDLLLHFYPFCYDTLYCLRYLNVRFLGGRNEERCHI